MATKHSDVQEVTRLKRRVKELEDEVSVYKKRLDDLRKAKNQTVLKREREVLEVSGPNLGRRRESGEPDTRVALLEKEIEELKLRHDEEIKDAELIQPQKPNFVCDHAEVIAELRRQVKELDEENALLRVENLDLKDRVDGLVMELSVKEAQWCEMEEKLTLKMKQDWGQKYAEWMQKTEQKIEELQHANNLMRTLLKKQGQRDGILPAEDPPSGGAGTA